MVLGGLVGSIHQIDNLVLIFIKIHANLLAYLWHGG